MQELLDTDVRMQAACQTVAEAFNARLPTNPVQFLECFEVQDHNGQWWTLEPFLEGSYTKHNNNYGYVAKDKRNTPQAFSHFSWEYTKGKLMIVDIQGSPRRLPTSLPASSTALLEVAANGCAWLCMLSCSWRHMADAGMHFEHIFTCTQKDAWMHIWYMTIDANSFAWMRGLHIMHGNACGCAYMNIDSS